MTLKALAASALLLVFLSGCGLTPIRPSDSHIRAEDVRPGDGVPPPVIATPSLPRPKPAVRPETYSVVVNNVPAQELLFALARDARLNIDVHPDVTGNVTLNAIDQTLPQILTRIARQIDMRYELDGPNLVIMRDTPFLRVYLVDYVNLARETRTTASLSTQVTASGQGAPASGASQNNTTSTITSQSNNRFWETLERNIRAILQETDRILAPGVASAAPPASSPAAPAPAALPPGTPAPGAAPVAGTTGTPANPQAGVSEFREAAAVIANPEAGIFTIRATSKQHEKIQEFIDRVMANARRQVLIEATVAEVQLNNQYQRGIDWSRLRTAGGAGFQFQQSTAGTPAGVSTGAFVFGYALPGANFTSAIRMLESFGDVRVLSSPKLSVLNNQTAVLKVVDNLVYFNVQSNTITSVNGNASTTFNTTPQTVPVGLIMSVVPQISETDAISLNVRPSISRVLRFVADPNPSLTTVQNLVPEIQTREMESMLRVQSNQIAVLGGLMQDRVSTIEDTIPGLRSIPGLGQLLAQRNDQNQKTELVIFLRPVVVRDASLEGDYRGLKSLLPGEDFFRRPNPGREETTDGAP